MTATALTVAICLVAVPVIFLGVCALCALILASRIGRAEDNN